MGRSRSSSSLLASLALLIGILVTSSEGVRKSYFYNFGQNAGDFSLPKVDEISSSEIKLRAPIVFFGQLYESLFVNSNGFVSFLTEIPNFFNIQFPLEYPIMAPFYSDVDTTGTGTVWYRETSDPTTVNRATSDLQQYFSIARNFTPSGVFIVTWDGVGPYSHRTDLVNTYQLVIVTDASDSYVMFHYAEGGIQWLQGDGKNPSLPDARGQAGLISGDGRFMTLKGSGTDQVRSLDKWSNTGTPGVFVYRVGRLKVEETVQSPDIGSDQSRDRASSQVQSCALGGSVCHSHSVCEDFTPGFCCKCAQSYFGNGLNCLEKDTPLRVTGKVSGSINGIDLQDADLHSYVLTQEGRTYTAISRIPAQIGYDIQSMTALGSGIAWLFAKPINNVPNGFSTTGGRMNRTVEIEFPQTGHQVLIQETFMGLDVFNNIQSETYIKGAVPTVPLKTKIEMDAFTEEYTRVKPGQQRARSSRAFRLQGQSIDTPFTVESTIDYEECSWRPRGLEAHDTLRLKVAENIFIQYDGPEQIVRYALSAKVAPLEEADPCVEGRQECGQNSQCVVDGDSFRCVCERGFEEVYDSTLNKGICLDKNECDTGRDNCHIDAHCINTPGSFTCSCKPGFTGDGVNCQREASCEGIPCDPNAECDLSTATPRCVCRQGYTGDGFFCAPHDVGVLVVQQQRDCIDDDICSIYADCLYDDTVRGFRCVCFQDYSGDGITCTPDGKQESCGTAYNCSPYGVCTRKGDIYECECLPGFTGDGYTCNAAELVDPNQPYQPLQPNLNHEDPLQPYDPQDPYGLQPQDPYPYQPQDPYQPTFRPDDSYPFQPQDPYQPPYQPQDPYQPPYRPEDPYQPPFQPEDPYQPPHQPEEPQDPYQPIQPEERPYQPPYQPPDLHQPQPEQPQQPEETEWAEPECLFGVCWCPGTLEYNSQRNRCEHPASWIVSSGNVENPSPYCSLAKCTCPEGYVYNDIYETCDSNYNDLHDFEARPSPFCYNGVCECPYGYVLDEGTNSCFVDNTLGYDYSIKGGGSHTVSCNVVNRCSPNAQCIYDSHSNNHICECNVGYEGDGYHCSETDVSCDQLNICHIHAQCVYDDFAFRHVCVCLPGYQGDGLVCTPQDECSSVQDCDVNAQCLYDSISRRYKCQCNEGFEGDGQICDPQRDASCNIVNNCDANANCIYDTYALQYRCQCRTGFEGDGTFCTPAEIGCNVVYNCGEHAECAYDLQASGYRCKCRQGFTGDGHFCRSSRSCLNDPSVCHPQASCQPDSKSQLGYSCRCREGFTGDGYSCQESPNHEKNLLLINQGLSVLRMSTDPRSGVGYPIHVNPFMTSVGADVDCLAGRYYWTDVRSASIRSSKYDGTEKAPIISGASNIGSPEDVAVDWISGNVYWTDSKHDLVSVVSVEEGGTPRVVIEDDLVNPRGIALHAGKGLLFWSDWNRLGPKIEVSGMDGSNRHILVDHDISLPNSLVVDYDTESLCWADAGTHKLECIGLDGRGRRVVMEGAQYPFGLTLLGDHFYYTDWNDTKIHSVDRYSGVEQPSKPPPPGGSGKLYGIAAVPPQCPPVSNVCGQGRGGCPATHLCLPNGRGGRTCACTDDAASDEENPCEDYYY